MRALGFDAKSVAPTVESPAVDDWRAKSPIGGARLAARHFSSRAGGEVPDLLTAIAEERPDALLVDILALGALSVAEASGRPWASFCPMPLPVPSRDTPPFGPGLRPARGPLGALLQRPVRAFISRATEPALRPRLDALRAALALPPLGALHELLLQAPLLIYMTAEGFEYHRSDWPQNVVMVGPCAWDPPAVLPRQLRDLEEPLILVATSSVFQRDARLVDAAFRAFEGERCHVVATLPAASADALEPPANATLLPFASHAPILERTVCAITHGGMGITQKALAQGVPVCAAPFGRDQFEVARRVEVAAAGSRLPAWHLSPRRLQKKVREAISRRAGAIRVARDFATLDGPRVAADEIERRLLGRMPTQP